MTGVPGRVVVIGATGTIGRPLSLALLQQGRQVVVFSRDPGRAKQAVPGATAYVAWSTGELSPECRQELGAADAVVYLAGAPLFDGRRHNRRDIERETADRVAGTAALVEALAGLDARPATLVAASSVGYYGYAGGTGPGASGQGASGQGASGHGAAGDVDEASPAGADWWGASSASIEQAAEAARPLGVRVVVLRTGYVLTDNSMNAQIAQFRRHFGGWIGFGQGWTPWIHLADEIGILTAALEQPAFDGPINATAPHPVTSRRFAQVLGGVLGHRAWLPVPTPLVRLGLGDVTDIMVKGKRVVPARALAAGYRFRFDTLEPALRDLLGGPVPGP